MIEGLSSRIEVFNGQELFPQELKKRVSDELCGTKGVESVCFDKSRITVEYYPQILSKSILRGRLEDLGVHFSVSAGRKRPLRRFLDRMITSNEKNFGTGTLDCCTLNSQEPKKHEE